MGHVIFGQSPSTIGPSSDADRRYTEGPAKLVLLVRFGCSSRSDSSVNVGMLDVGEDVPLGHCVAQQVAAHDPLLQAYTREISEAVNRIPKTGMEERHPQEIMIS